MKDCVLNGGIYVRRGSYDVSLTKKDLEMLTAKFETLINAGNTLETTLATLKRLKLMLNEVTDTEVVIMKEWTFATNFYTLSIENNKYKLYSITPKGLKDTIYFDNMNDIDKYFIPLEEFLAESTFVGEKKITLNPDAPLYFFNLTELYKYNEMSLVEVKDLQDRFVQYAMYPDKVLNKYNYKIVSLVDAKDNIKKLVYQDILDDLIDFRESQKRL